MPKNSKLNNNNYNLNCLIKIVIILRRKSKLTLFVTSHWNLHIIGAELEKGSFQEFRGYTYTI